MKNSHHGHHSPRKESLIRQKLGEIRDPELLALIDELNEQARLPSEAFQTLTLGYIIDAILHSGPNGTRKVFRSEEFDQIGPATLTLRKLRVDYPTIYQFCEEVAQSRGSSLDLFNGHKLYSFLNMFAPSGNAGRTKPRRGIHAW